MKPSLYLVAVDLPGKLFIMPKPSGEWLEDDIGYYRLMGAELIVSMLERDEAAELSLENEAQVCAAHQLDFLQFQIPDRGLPDVAPFKKFVLNLIGQLKSGRGVAVHCRAGIGRSGMVVCCVLAAFLGSAEQAVAQVSEIRGVNVPDTLEQLEFIKRVSAEIAAAT